MTGAADEAATANAEIARLLKGEYERLFRASAEAFVRASERGIPDLHIAHACRHLFESEEFSPTEADELYTSPSAVGHHRRTGMILRKPGGLPHGVKARDVQALIKKLKVGDAEAVIRDCVTQEDAWSVLRQLTGRPDGPKGRQSK